MADDDFRRRNPRFQREALDHNLELLSTVRRLAADKGVTPGQLALAWVLAQGDDVVPIPGTKRVRYLEENVAAAAVELSEADLTVLADAIPRERVVGERFPDMSSIDR
jgi:aryl-alcohol dehydrogenase-like predicted oxidoreductase